MTDLYLGIGGNTGDRINNLRSAIVEISERIGKPEAISSIYMSEPWGFEHNKYFLNIVARVKTKKSPEQILSIIGQIESALKREKHYTSRYEARSIDIDILFYGNCVIESEDLNVPHPKLCDRLFVLLPLQDIEPNFRYFPNNKDIFQLICECKDSGNIRKLAEGYRRKII